MSNLFNRKPKDSYQELLTVDNTGAGFDTSLRSILDGTGTATPLKLSTTTISLDGLSWPSVAPTTGQVLSVASSSTLEWIDPDTNAGTVTSVAVTGNSKISVTGSPITSSGTIALDITESGLTISNMAGTLATTHGGTGLTTLGTANQVLRVNAGATGLEYATATTGTVTSVGVTAGSTKLSVSGSPVTTSGSITLDVTEANLNHANIGGTVPTTKGGTGLTAIGTGLQYLRVNAGATGLEFATLTATGTVTSVGVTAGSSKVTVSGSPITTSGAITVDVAEGVLNVGNMTGTLGVTHGGTGLTTIGTTGQSIRVNTAGTGYEFYTPSSTTVDIPSPFMFLGC